MASVELLPNDDPRLLRRALPLAAPALLILVALLQIWRAHTLDQSSWAGVGFGMFATFENEQTRTVRIDMTGADGTVTPVDPRRAPGLELAAREVPTDGNLTALAEWAFEARPDTTSITVAVDGIDVSVTDDADGRSVEVTTRRLASIVWIP